MRRRLLVSMICGAGIVGATAQFAAAGPKNSLKLSAPKAVRVDVDYTMKITGRASQRALLSIDINSDRCRSTWRRDQQAPNVHEYIRLRKIGAGRIKLKHTEFFPHHSEGDYNFCAYLMSRRGHKTLARAHRKISVNA